jgi:hypothetical protein
MRERKLRSAVNWQGALNEEGLKQRGVKEGLGVKLNLLFFIY